MLVAWRPQEWHSGQQAVPQLDNSCGVVSRSANSPARSHLLQGGPNGLTLGVFRPSDISAADARYLTYLVQVRGWKHLVWWC